MNKIEVTGMNLVKEFVTPEELEMLLYFGFVEFKNTTFDKVNNRTIDHYRRTYG